MLHLNYFERRNFYAHVLHLHLFELSKATYEIGPKVMDIQERYNKNSHVDHWIWYVWFLAIVLRYGDSNMWVMLVSNYALVSILVLRFVIPYASMKVISYAMKLHPTCGALFGVSYA